MKPSQMEADIDRRRLMGATLNLLTKAELIQIVTRLLGPNKSNRP